MSQQPASAAKAFHMTDSAKKNWRENPPNAPWSSPPVVHNQTGATSRNSQARYSGRKMKQRGAKSHTSRANVSLPSHEIAKNPDSAWRHEQKGDRDRAANSCPASSGFYTNKQAKFTTPESLSPCKIYNHPQDTNSPISVGSTSMKDTGSPQDYCKPTGQRAPGPFVKGLDNHTMTPPTPVGLGIADSLNNLHFQSYTNNNSDEEASSPVTSSVNSDSTSPATSPERERDEKQQDNQNFDPDATPKMASASMSLGDQSTATEMIEQFDPLLWTNVVPFEGTTIFSLPPQWPVIKILNVPFTVTKPEIMQFLGYRAKPLLTNTGPAIHIIMERSTGKTMDCFVEFPGYEQASETLAFINRGLVDGQPAKIGARYIQAEMSSQDELLKAMFPRAKCITWQDGLPMVLPKMDAWSTGFTGFITEEELFLAIRHAEAPQRSPFISRCLQRPYDFMISTLNKFPWYAPTLYKVKDRNYLFTATWKSLRILGVKAADGRTPGLDRQLVIDLLASGLGCPGFNDRQKFALQLAATNYSIIDAAPIFSRFWPFDTLTIKSHAHESLIMNYAQLIAKGIEVCPPKSDHFQNNFDPVYHSSSPFGRLNLEWLESNDGPVELTYADAINLEMALMRRVLAAGVMVYRQEEAARTGIPFRPMVRSSLGMERPPNPSAVRPTSMHIPPVHEVIFSLLPKPARAHHYGFDPESLLQDRQHRHQQHSQDQFKGRGRDHGSENENENGIIIAEDHRSQSYQTDGVHVGCSTPPAQNGYSNGHSRDKNKPRIAEVYRHNDNDNSNSNSNSNGSKSSDGSGKQASLGPIGHRRGGRHSRNSLSADFHVQAQRGPMPGSQKAIRCLSMPEVIEEDDS